MNIVIGGSGIPIGIADNTLNGAVRNRPVRGKGCNFTAFVIPNNSKTVTYDKDEFRNNKKVQDVRKRIAMIESE